MDTKKNLYCAICDGLKENPWYALCRKCTPFLYKKQGSPHQKATKTKKWIENKAIKIKEAGNKCQWCDSEKKPFSIHHPKEINARTYDHIWDKIVINCIAKDAAFVKSYNLRIVSEQKMALQQKLKDRKEAAKKSMVGTCPNCLSSRYHERKTLTPRYRCTSCKNEFDTLKKRLTNKLARSIENIETKLKNQDYSYISVSPSNVLGPVMPFIYDEALKTYDETVQQLVSDYVEMKDTIVLCKKCHNVARRGYVFCEKCKKSYRRPQNETCYSCHIEEKGETTEKEDDKDVIWDEEDWEDPEFLDMVNELKEEFGEDWEKKLKELSDKIMKEV